MVTSWRFKSSHPHQKIKGEPLGSPFLLAASWSADILVRLSAKREPNLNITGARLSVLRTLADRMSALHRTLRSPF